MLDSYKTNHETLTKRSFTFSSDFLFKERFLRFSVENNVSKASKQLPRLKMLIFKLSFPCGQKLFH